MGATLAAVLAFIVLGGPFGEATVEGERAGDRLRVEFEVEVAGTPAAVVVHAVDPGQSQETISLAERSGDRWGGVADLDLMNYVLVFEVVYPDAEGAVSEPTTLLELGLDPGVIGMEDFAVGGEDEGDQPLSAVTKRWGWGAVALAAVALALLAVWAMGDRTKAQPEVAEETVQSTDDS